MGRWEPGARERMAAAALDLFTERGFDQTTAADIAERAGVTERTFFRHYADKREVLFDGSALLQRTVEDGIADGDASGSPIDLVCGAFDRAAPLLESRGDYPRLRAAVIYANPGLLERELLKLATLRAAAAAALRLRGVADTAAELAAETGVTVFHVGFQRWVSTPGSTLSGCMRDTLAELRQLVATT